jgi:hypothetical protein
MDNKDPWFSYDKVSTNSDAFAYVQEIGNDLSDSLEHLNQGSPVRAKGLPTEKYTAGNTNDVMEGVHEESFLTQTPSKISRRYSPMSKSEYSGYRPPDPVFLSYNNNQTTNTFLPEPLAKHKTIQDIEQVQVNNKFVVNKLSSESREAAIAPEALELINILNPVEAREIQNNTFSQDVRVEKYTSQTPPIEIKKVETKTVAKNIVQSSAPIVIGKPKVLTTFNQNNSINNQSNNLKETITNESVSLETTGPTFNQNFSNSNNLSAVSQTNIEVKKPVLSPKISQYTNTIDFNSFVSSTFAEIVDQKSEQKILSKNNINVRKLITDINLFLEQNKREFKDNVSNSVNQFFSTYSDENLSTLQSTIENVIINSNNIQNVDTSVARVVNEYFSKNENEVNQNIAAEFINHFNSTLQNQLMNLQNSSKTEMNILQNVNTELSNIQNIFESKQSEIEKIISEVNNDNVLTKVVELSNTYEDYKTLSTSSINNLATQINQSSLSEIKETYNQQVSNFESKNQLSLNNFKQEMMGFVFTYLNTAVSQEVLNAFSSTVTTSTSIEEIKNTVNKFVSNNKTESNSQTIDSLQYFTNDKYTNLVSATLVETVENNILKYLSNVVQNYSNQDVIQNTLISQIKNDLSQSLKTEIKNTVNSFNLKEIRTSLENVYKSQDINQIKTEFNSVLNKSENRNNTQVISYLNNLLENNISSYTSKSVNVLNESRYSNSVKNMVNENLHNVVANIVHNLSEVNTYSDNKNIATLINNIKIINDRLLVNNAENRLQNFNLIQTSIDNFLSNTANSYNQKLSEIKINQTSYDEILSENLNVFETLNTNTNSQQISEVRNIISETNLDVLNQESKQFIQEAKLYSDLINMKNQVTSEINNFVNNTFETILAVNQNSTVISTQQIINLIEETVSTFNLSDISNNALTHIKNVMEDVKKPELYNNTFQLITSTNILEDQIKNYLLQNNSMLADFSLQQIMNTINQPMYSEYVTFQDIKEIINKSTNTSSFGILSEVKQYINQINSQENTEFISNLKTYLSENQTNLVSSGSVSFTEQLKNFISEQNSYSTETFNQIINSVSNKFENKSATILNDIINENVSKLNQVVETLYSSISNNQSKETILNTLSTFLNNNLSFADNDNEFITQESNSFKQDNSEFLESINNILISNNNTLSEEIKNNLKTEILNNFSSQILAILNENNISNEEVNNILSSSSSVETKINDIKNYLSTIENTYLNSSIISNQNNISNSGTITENFHKDINVSNEINYIKSLLNTENLKIELVNNSDKISVENLDTVIQNVVSKNILELQKTSVISNSSINKIEEFKNLIYNAESFDVVQSYNNQNIQNILNQTKTQILSMINVLQITEDIKNQISNQVSNALSLSEIKNAIQANSHSLSIAENNALTNITNENFFVSNVVNSVTETFKSEITNNKSEVESYLNIATVEYLQNRFNQYISSPSYKSDTYLNSLTKFIEENVSNPVIVLNTINKVASYADGDQISVNNLIKTVDNLYQSGSLNNTQNINSTYETFERNNIEFLNTINDVFSTSNIQEITTSLNNLSTEITNTTQSTVQNIAESISQNLRVDKLNISNIEDIENLILNLNQFETENSLSLREEIMISSIKSYVSNEYLKTSMLQNILNQVVDINTLYTYNTQTVNEQNLSQEEKISLIKQQNEQFLNQYTQQFISENLSSSSTVSNITKLLNNNFTVSNLSTQAISVVNEINNFKTETDINNFAKNLEEKSFNEAKTTLSNILNNFGKTEISQMILNTINTSDLKNVIQNNFNNLDTFERNISEKTLNEAFYINNKLSEAMNIFKGNIQGNRTNISSYIATQTLTNIIQAYVDNKVNNSSIGIVNNLPKTNINQAMTLASALSSITNGNLVNNLLALNQNTFSVSNEKNLYSAINFKFDQEFKDTVQSITTNINTENIATELNTYKQEVFDQTLSTVNEVMNQTSTKIDNFDIITNNQSYSSDEKIENILKNINTSISNTSLSSQEIKNLETIRNYVLNESYKIETLNKISSQDIFLVKNFDEFENEITTRIQQNLISPSFIEFVNKFRTYISQSNTTEEVSNYANEQKTIVLNELKSQVSNFISVVKPEYLNTENLNTINNATSIEQISNLISENNNQFTSSENNTLSTLLTQGSVFNNIVSSVINSISNNSSLTQGYITQEVDDIVYEVVQNQISLQNESIIRNIISNIQQLNISESTSKEEINNIVYSLVNTSINNQATYFNNVLNAFKISSIEKQINTLNTDIIRAVNNVVEKYDISKLLTNTINENISLNQNILNSEVIETVSQIIEQNSNVSTENISMLEVLNTVSTNQQVVEQIQNSINSSSIKELFNKTIINELASNTYNFKSLLSQKTPGNVYNFNAQYLNTISSTMNEARNTVVNEVKNEVEKIENITLNFENQTNYQKSSIEIYDDVLNKIESTIHPDYDKVSLIEKPNSDKSISNNNEFKNITVVKQIDENEDVQVSNLRIEKVWNQFVQEEVNKIVEEVSNSSETKSENNVYNNITNVQNNTTSESSNISQTNIYSGDVNKSEYYNISNRFENIGSTNSSNKTFEKIEKQIQREAVTQEVIQKVDYQEITDIVFSRVEQKLKTYNVSNEDIIILKHRILTEVAEYYEKRSKYDQERTEEKLKKEMESLFIKFLNS